MDVLADERRVGSLPSASFVEHGGDVGDEDVVVGARVAGASRGVAGVGVDEATGRGRRRRSTPAATSLAHQLFEVLEGGVALGVEDGVHVVGSADDAELGDRLVGADDEFHPGSFGVGESDPGVGIGRATGAEDGLVVPRVDRSGQAEQPGAPPAPAQWGLAPAAVVVEGRAGVVVAPAEHGGLVVGDRLGAHHAHERHRSLPRPGTARDAVQPAGCKRVLRSFGLRP